MRKHILIIQGHPDVSHDHLGHALAAAYEKGARESDFEVKTICVANIEFPLLRTYEDFYSSKPLPVIKECQQDIRWANHMVIFYPLWMGSMPALLKAFFEQVFPSRFCHGACRRRQEMGAAAEGKICPCCGNNGHASIYLPLGLPCPWTKKSRT